MMEKFDFFFSGIFEKWRERKMGCELNVDGVHGKILLLIKIKLRQN